MVLDDDLKRTQWMIYRLQINSNLQEKKIRKKVNEEWIQKRKSLDFLIAHVDVNWNPVYLYGFNVVYHYYWTTEAKVLMWEKNECRVESCYMNWHCLRDLKWLCLLMFLLWWWRNKKKMRMWNENVWVYPTNNSCWVIRCNWLSN